MKPVVHASTDLLDPACRRYLEEVRGNGIDQMMSALLGDSWNETVTHYATACHSDCQEQTDDRIRSSRARRELIERSYAVSAWKNCFTPPKAQEQRLAWQAYRHLSPIDAPLIAAWIEGNLNSTEELARFAGGMFQLQITMLRYRAVLGALATGLLGSRGAL